MKLDDLIKKGGIVNTQLVQKTADWTRSDDSGKQVTDEVKFFVRRASHVMFKQAFSGAALADGSKLDQDSALIVSHIRLGEDGSEALTYEQATSLETNLAIIFTNAINEVYQAADPKPKSRQKKSSGVNSSSTASAAKRSKKPKTA